jgi:hypothetical protein
MGERYRAIAETYGWIRTHTPPNTVLQSNPDRTAFHYGLYAERPALAVGGDCEGYSARPSDCVVIKAAVRPLFNGTRHDDPLADVCRRFPLDLLILDDTDFTFKDRTSWVWRAHPVFETPFSKVFACRAVPGIGPPKT